MDTVSILQLIILLILLIFSAFFSSAETAFTTINRVKLRTYIEQGNKRASLVDNILEQYGKMLSTILIGNNIVNISASSLATTLTIRLWGNVAVGIVTGLLTLLVLIFGEIVPKTWASLKCEPIAFFYAPIIRGMMLVLTPIILIVDQISNFFLRLLKIDPSQKDAPITEHELKTYVAVSHEGGEIESEEREMIYNVFDFTDARAKDIMIPRIDMTTAPLDATYQELLGIFRESMFTRIPIYSEDPDHIIGLVNIKDFILVDDEEHFKISDILREAYLTYEFKKTADLMMEMRQKSFSISFVLSEYGSTVGMITMEDLLEEIVGEIRDEYDDDEADLIKEIDATHYLVDGGMKISDLNDALDSNLESQDYDSIGGLMIEQLERLPSDNEMITLEDGTQLTARGIKQNRILKVLVAMPTKNEETAEK